jgi:hypothetical protein
VIEMKKSKKAMFVLIALTLVCTVISTSGLSSVLENDISNTLLSNEKRNFVRITIRGRIKDLEKGDGEVSFIAIRVVITATFCVNGTQDSITLVLKEGDGRQTWYLDNFIGLCGPRYIFGVHYWDLNNLPEDHSLL